MEGDIRHAFSRTIIRDGDRRFHATRYDDDTVSIGAFVRRPELDGSAHWHWTKPTDEAGEIIAHASEATWRAGVLVPAPADGPEDHHVDLRALMRPEAIEAMALALRGAKQRAVLVELQPAEPMQIGLFAETS